MPWAKIDGLSWRNRDGVIVHNADRAILEDMDQLPWVTPIYKRDLVIENYFGGYLKHPYISFYHLSLFVVFDWRNPDDGS